MAIIIAPTIFLGCRNGACWTIGLLLASLIALPARADDAPECFSPYTQFNVCAEIREFHKAIAPMLPMRVSANMTMHTMIAAGPRLAVTVIWHLDKEELDRSMHESGVTPTALSAQLREFARNAVCGAPELAALVRLGGKLQYVYQTSQGDIIANPVISSC